jgi:hypothetical protein
LRVVLVASPSLYIGHRAHEAQRGQTLRPSHPRLERGCDRRATSREWQPRSPRRIERLLPIRRVSLREANGSRRVVAHWAISVRDHFAWQPLHPYEWSSGSLIEPAINSVDVDWRERSGMKRCRCTSHRDGHITGANRAWLRKYRTAA